MIKRAMTVCAALASAPLAAQTPPDNAVVTATIKALAAGDVGEAEWLVSHVGSLQFPSIALADRADALKALAGCKATEQSRGQAGPYAYYVFEWKCPGRTFIGKLVPEEGNLTVALADFLRAAEYKERSARFPSVILAPAPGPPPTRLLPRSPESQARENQRRAAEMAGKKELAGQFAQAMADGDISAFRTRHATYARIRYGFVDPFSGREYVDRMWQSGGDVAEAGQAMADAVAHVRSQFGQPVSWSCEDAFPSVECTWRYSEPGTRLTAQIHVFGKNEPNWGINIFQFRYETAGKVAEARRRRDMAGEAIP